MNANRWRLSFMLQKMKKGRWVIGMVLLIFTIALGADYGYRCLRPPLTKEEAIARAKVRLARYSQSSDMKEAMTLSDVTFQPNNKVWLVTFVGQKCKVILIVDRCHGDDVGSTNACAG
jgi:hypothetical protein